MAARRARGRRDRQRQRRPRRRPRARQARRRPALDRDPRQRARRARGVAPSPTCTSSAAAAPPTSSSRRSSCASSARCPTSTSSSTTRTSPTPTPPTRRRTTSSRSCSRILNSWRDARADRRDAGACTCTSTTRPSRCSATDRVEGVRFERTEPVGDGGVARHRRAPRVSPCRRSTARSATTARPCVDAPFDERRGVIPNVEGRVRRRVRRAAPGPLRDRLDQARTGRPHRPHQVRRDGDDRPPRRGCRGRRARRARPSTATCSSCSTSARSPYTTWDGWLALDAHERELGASHRAHRASASRSCRATSRSRSRAPARSIAVMTYVIALPCVDVKDRACIDECPVDCIYEGERSLYIHPDECVDCGACEPVCPVEAIYYEDDLPDEWQDYYTANVEFFDDIGSPGGAAKVGVIAQGPPRHRRAARRRVTAMADRQSGASSSRSTSLIIGGGPAGLSAALNLGRARASRAASSTPAARATPRPCARTASSPATASRRSSCASSRAPSSTPTPTCACSTATRRRRALRCRDGCRRRHALHRGAAGPRRRHAAGGRRPLGAGRDGPARDAAGDPEPARASTA